MIKSLSIRNTATFNDDGITMNELSRLILSMALTVQVKVQSARSLLI